MPTLQYLGHSAFLLEADGAVVAVDPFLSGNPKASHAEGDIHPQTILLTHAHNDHVGDTIVIAKRTGATVITTVELADWLTGQGVEAVGANHGGTVAFAGGTVKIVPAWHSSSYLHEGTRVAHGVPAGLVVRVGGATVYVAGDTCLFGDMALIGEEGVDVAVLPIGDHFTMGPADAVRAAKLLKPKIVVPCHYDTFPPIEQDAAAFARQVEADAGCRCALLKPGETLDLEEIGGRG